MKLIGKGFDREMGLLELLPGMDLDRLKKDLTLLLGNDFALCNSEGEVILGERSDHGKRIPLNIELEPVGYLESSADENAMKGATGMLVALLKCGKLCRMASELHIEAINSDYAALKESEEKYRTLAEELDSRVKAQVKTIETAQRQLYQSEKLASVGQLAAGVAHEINNPIGFVRSNLSTAKSYLETLNGLSGMKDNEVSAYWKNGNLDFVLEDFKELLVESISGIDRVARIVADLKGFSNVDGAQREAVDLNENLRSACNMISGKIRDRIALSMDLSPLPEFTCHPGPINQMLLNLLLNAVQAIPEKGNIAVRTRAEKEAIVICIKDDGCGIPDDILPRIFDPFFTTKPVGSGTGLGLAVCRDIANAHGGKLLIESLLGKGTAVTIQLPFGAS